MRSTAIALALLHSLPTLGCGSPDSALELPSNVGGRMGSAARGGATSGGTGGVAGARDAGVTGNGGTSTAGMEGHGVLILVQLSREPSQIELRARFGEGLASDCPPVSTYGNCRLHLCPTSDPSLPSGVVWAGVVSAVSAPVGLALSSAPDEQAPTDWYPDVQQTLVGDFAGGETVTFAATGGVVPPFSQALTMLAPLVLTQPSSTAFRIPISRDGVTLTWRPGEAGTEVRAAAFGGDGTFTFMECVWDASTGTGLLPPEILKSLRNSQEIVVSARRQVERTAGRFTIEVSALVGAQAVDGRPRALVLTDPL